MNLSDIKLIVTDMDGTLLNSKHEVSDLFFDQFEKLKKHKIHFVAASGRQYHSILDKLKSIEKHITIVAENGAYVVQNGKELFVNAISDADINMLLPICKKIPNTYIVLCGKKKAYILKDTPQKFKNTITEYYSEYVTLDSFDIMPDDDFFKIALCNYEGSEENIYPSVKHLNGDWQIKISGKLWVDISQNTSHKGNAIAEIQKNHGITEAQTMAFGDYNNDLEMLKKASFSYAMQNAHPDVKKIARFETFSNDNKGVEAIIKELLEHIKD